MLHRSDRLPARRPMRPLRGMHPARALHPVQPLQPLKRFAAAGLLAATLATLAACGSEADLEAGTPGADTSSVQTAKTVVSASPQPSVPDAGASAALALLVDTKVSTNKVDPVVRPGADAPVDSVSDGGNLPDTRQRLFATGFETGVSLTEPEGVRQQWRHLVGGDVVGQDFQAERWGAPANQRHWIESALEHDTGAPFTQFLTATLKEVTGRTGATGRALSLDSPVLSGGRQQIAVQIGGLTVEPMFYQRMWVKFDPDTLARAQGAGQWFFTQTFWEASTASDYRLRIKLRYEPGTGLYWQAKADAMDGNPPLWQVDQKAVPVVLAPAGASAGWHQVEIWLDRPGQRFKVAVDGVSVVDHVGPLAGAQSQPLSVIKPMMVWGDPAPRAEVLFDDVEYWATPPAGAFQAPAQ